MPSLRLRRALADAPDGARLRLITDDPLARIDVPLFLRDCGQAIDIQRIDGVVITFELVKAATV